MATTGSTDKSASKEIQSINRIAGEVNSNGVDLAALPDSEVVSKKTALIAQLDVEQEAARQRAYLEKVNKQPLIPAVMVYVMVVFGLLLAVFIVYALFAGNRYNKYGRDTELTILGSYYGYIPPDRFTADYKKREITSNGSTSFYYVNVMGFTKNWSVSKRRLTNVTGVLTNEFSAIGVPTKVQGNLQVNLINLVSILIPTWCTATFNGSYVLIDFNKTTDPTGKVVDSGYVIVNTKMDPTDSVYLAVQESHDGGITIQSTVRYSVYGDYLFLAPTVAHNNQVPLVQNLGKMWTDPGYNDSQNAGVYIKAKYWFVSDECMIVYLDTDTIVRTDIYNLEYGYKNRRLFIMGNNGGGTSWYSDFYAISNITYPDYKDVVVAPETNTIISKGSGTTFPTTTSEHIVRSVALLDSGVITYPKDTVGYVVTWEYAEDGELDPDYQTNPQIVWYNIRRPSSAFWTKLGIDWPIDFTPIYTSPGIYVGRRWVCVDYRQPSHDMYPEGVIVKQGLRLYTSTRAIFALSKYINCTTDNQYTTFQLVNVKPFLDFDPASCSYKYKVSHVMMVNGSFFAIHHYDPWTRWDITNNTIYYSSIPETIYGVMPPNTYLAGKVVNQVTTGRNNLLVYVETQIKFEIFQLIEMVTEGMTSVDSINKPVLTADQYGSGYLISVTVDIDYYLMAHPVSILIMASGETTLNIITQCYIFTTTTLERPRIIYFPGIPSKAKTYDWKTMKGLIEIDNTDSEAIVDMLQSDVLRTLWKDKVPADIIQEYNRLMYNGSDSNIDVSNQAILDKVAEQLLLANPPGSSDDTNTKNIGRLTRLLKKHLQKGYLKEQLDALKTKKKKLIKKPRQPIIYVNESVKIPSYLKETNQSLRDRMDGHYKFIMNDILEYYYHERKEMSQQMKESLMKQSQENKQGTDNDTVTEQVDLTQLTTEEIYQRYKGFSGYVEQPDPFESIDHDALNSKEANSNATNTGKSPETQTGHDDVVYAERVQWRMKEQPKQRKGETFFRKPHDTDLNYDYTFVDPDQYTVMLDIKSPKPLPYDWYISPARYNMLYLLWSYTFALESGVHIMYFAVDNNKKNDVFETVNVNGIDYYNITYRDPYGNIVMDIRYPKITQTFEVTVSETGDGTGSVTPEDPNDGYLPIYMKPVTPSDTSSDAHTDSKVHRMYHIPVLTESDNEFIQPEFTFELKNTGSDIPANTLSMLANNPDYALFDDIYNLNPTIIPSGSTWTWKPKFKLDKLRGMFVKDGAIEMVTIMSSDEYLDKFHQDVTEPNPLEYTIMSDVYQATVSLKWKVHIMQ